MVERLSGGDPDSVEIGFEHVSRMDQIHKSASITTLYRIRLSFVLKVNVCMGYVLYKKFTMSIN